MNQQRSIKCSKLPVLKITNWLWLVQEGHAICLSNLMFQRTAWTNKLIAPSQGNTHRICFTARQSDLVGDPNGWATELWGAAAEFLESHHICCNIIRQELARADSGAVLNKTWYLLKCFGWWLILFAQYSSLFQQHWKKLWELQKSSHSNSKEMGLFFSQPWVNSNDTKLWQLGPSCAEQTYSVFQFITEGQYFYCPPKRDNWLFC